MVVEIRGGGRGTGGIGAGGNDASGAGGLSFPTVEQLVDPNRDRGFFGNLLDDFLLGARTVARPRETGALLARRGGNLPSFARRGTPAPVEEGLPDSDVTGALAQLLGQLRTETSGGRGGGGGPSISAIQADFSRARADLEDLFQFTETDEEKAALEFALNEIRNRAKEDVKALAEGFGLSVEDIEEKSESARKAGRRQARRTEAELRREARRAERTARRTAGEFDVSGGLGGDAAADLVAEIEASAGTEGRLDRRLGDINANEIAQLAASLEGEGELSQGDVRRLASTIEAGRVREHQNRVNDRIAAQQAQFAQLLAQLEQQRLASITSARQQAAAQAAAAGRDRTVDPLLRAVEEMGLLGALTGDEELARQTVLESLLGEGFSLPQTESVASSIGGRASQLR